MTIDDLLTKKEFQIRELLRVNHIKGSGLEGIKNGYVKYGDKFMMKVIDKLKDESNNFQNMTTTTQVPLIDTGDPELDAQANARQEVLDQTGKTWTFWANVLTTMGDTGKTIAELKKNVLGSVSGSASGAASGAPQASSNIILYLAGAAILVVVVIIIIKNKKK